MELTFFGTNTLLIKKNGSTLLIDPHFSRPSLFTLLKKIKPDEAKIRAGLRVIGVENIDGILLSHTHYDHAMDAAAICRQIGGVIYGSESAGNLAKGADLSKKYYRVVKLGDSIQLGEFRVSWLASHHISFPHPLGWLMAVEGKIADPISPPIHFWNYSTGDVYAILIDYLLVFGSAGFVPGAYSKCGAQVVVLGIGGVEIKSARYLENLYRETVLASDAQRVLISHWDNFFKPLSRSIKPLGLAKQTIHRINKLGDRHGQSVEVLNPGETIIV